MKPETNEELKKVFVQAVTVAVAKGGGVRWGEAESLAVVEAMVEAMLASDDAMAKGFDAIRANVGKVVNPSAFAQALEKLPEGNPRRIVRPKRGTGGSRVTDDLK